jgi:hypothetical protein
LAGPEAAPQRLGKDARGPTAHVPGSCRERRDGVWGYRNVDGRVDGVVVTVKAHVSAILTEPDAADRTQPVTIALR